MVGCSICRKWRRGPRFRSPSMPANAAKRRNNERPHSPRILEKLGCQGFADRGRRGAARRHDRPVPRSRSRRTRQAGHPDDIRKRLRPSSAAKVALPRRARGNAWAAAQHIESNKHRSTVTALMSEAFAAPVEPTPMHRYLASLRLPMIVDTWYDGAMRTALGERSDWGEVQGITRAGIGEDRWYRFYDAAGAETDRTRGAKLGHRALQAPWQYRAGEEFPDFGRGLCRGADGDRHPDADPGRREGPAHPAQLCLHRLPFQRPAVADLCPPDHQAVIDDALCDRRARKLCPATNSVS